MDSATIRRAPDGMLYLVWAGPLSETPTMSEQWFALGTDGYGLLNADDALPLALARRGGGQYRDETGRDWYLPGGGNQLPEFSIHRAIPCPKVRAGVETRWSPSQGAWQKYLKTKGWVLA